MGESFEFACCSGENGTSVDVDCASAVSSWTDSVALIGLLLVSSARVSQDMGRRISASSPLVPRIIR